MTFTVLYTVYVLFVNFFFNFRSFFLISTAIFKHNFKQYYNTNTFCIGATISAIVIIASGVASISFPASSIRSRVCMSACVSASSIFTAYLALKWFSNVQINLDIAATIVTAAAISVAVASSWATGILVCKSHHNCI